MLSLEELKKLVKTLAFLAEMEEVFFEAADDGYAGNPKRSTVIELPGSVEITFTKGPWKVVDKYFKTSLGRRSGGGMVMSYEEVHVWMMHYGGQYEKEAIPCLKAALSAAYAEKKFFGGRGPEEFVHGEFVYHNEVDRAYRADFQTSNFFRGYEKITKVGRNADGTTQKAMGWHSCQGMMMV